jgi:hypothetical protein
MTAVSNPSAPGAPVQVVAEQPVRAPLDGFTPWATPTLAIPLGADAQVRPVSAAMQEFAGGKNYGVNSRAGADI